MKKFTPKQEGVMSIVAALLVLFSAMLDPIVSVVLSFAAIMLFAIYSFLKK